VNARVRRPRYALGRVFARRLSAPSLLGLAAAAAGLIGVVSALTPEMASRSELVRGVLPPGVPETARVVALALGLALIWLSRSLARRKHRAWQLAIGVVVASAAAHLAKGLDFEEALATCPVGRPVALAANIRRSG